MALFQIASLTTSLSRGNIGTLADGFNQFFSLNPNLTVVDLRFSFRRQGVRAQRQAHLVYNTTPAGQTPATSPGGARHYALQFTDSPGGQTAAQKATTFFAANPQFTLVLARFLPPETAESTYLFRRSLLVVYTAASTRFALNAPQIAAFQPPALVVGGVARAAVLGDSSVYPQPLMNVGNGAWPAGAPGIAVRQVDGGTLNHWAGIAPTCSPTTSVPPANTTTSVPSIPCESTTTTTAPIPPSTTTYTTTTTPPPPPGYDCCLQAAWDCFWTGTASIWVLDAGAVSCVPNANCAPFEVTTCA